MPQPTVLETAADESAGSGDTTQTGGARTDGRRESVRRREVGFALSAGLEHLARHRALRPSPKPKIRKAFPAAPEAMRRYDAQQAAGRGGRGEIRPLTYADEPTAAQISG